MKKQRVSRVSIGDIAKEAGVSRSTVSYVLNNRPGPSTETREQVLRAARQLNYSPDARMHSFMARVRDSKAKDLLPIIWLNTQPEGYAVWHQYKWLAPYIEGATERCAQLGYRLEEVWTRAPGFSMRQLAHMIHRRGIEGVVITHPIRHVRLNWKNLAGVALEGTLQAPMLNRVMTDTLSNLQLAYKSVQKLGYQRIGICLTEHMDHISEHRQRLFVHYTYSMASGSRKIRPLIHPFSGNDATRQVEFTEWLSREKPDVVIGCHNCLVRWARQAGFRVPEDLGIVHLALDDDVLDWTGVYSNRREIGRVAVEQVISMIQHRKFGVPELPHQIYVRGMWRMGSTALTVKSRGNSPIELPSDPLPSRWQRGFDL